MERSIRVCVHISHRQHDLSLYLYRMNEYTSAVYVSVKTRTGTEEAFTEASLKNARNMAPGVACFDVVLQEHHDESTFVMVEIFKANKAGWNHKDTFKYL